MVCVVQVHKYKCKQKKCKLLFHNPYHGLYEENSKYYFVQNCSCDIVDFDQKFYIPFLFDYRLDILLDFLSFNPFEDVVLETQISCPPFVCCQISILAS